jgi:hypothetical protein
MNSFKFAHSNYPISYFSMWQKNKYQATQQVLNPGDY